MRLRVAFLALLVGLASVAVSSAAEIDCLNIEPSTGPVPKELAEVCGSGSQGGAPVGIDFPGDRAFGPEMANDNLIDMTLDNPEVLNPIGPLAPVFIGACEFAYFFDILYCTDSNNAWFSIDTATGLRNDIGLLDPQPPVGHTVTGLAFDGPGGQMYVCTTDTTSSSLMRVIQDGTTFPVGTITNSPGIIACAVDLDGNLWGYDIVTDMLLSIDKTTGAGTEVGPIGFDASFGQGMDFDDSDGTCYMFAFNNGLFQAELRTCDTSTGATTLVGVIGATTPGGLTQVSGAGIATVSFRPTMFAIEEETDDFHGMNPLTGQSVLIGHTGENFNGSGLAWDSWNKVMYVSDVSNPSSFGLGKVNIYTGDISYIGPHVSSVDIYGLAFDSVNNVLYGSDHDNNCLATINRQTGEATCVGPFGTTDFLSGLAFDNDTDTLFGIDPTSLYTVNRNTGQATIVGPHGLTPSLPWRMGLDYNSELGALFAAFSGNPFLYELNPGTGMAVIHGNHGLVEIGGLASTMTPGAPCGIFCDGFESGDTTMWQ